MPPVWHKHPVVEKGRRDGKLVLPLGLYFDAVRYGGKGAAGRQSSIYVFSIVNLYVVVGVDVGAGLGADGFVDVVGVGTVALVGVVIVIDT
eukprot:13613998-Alexandrium_andersonii.AAC.1